MFELEEWQNKEVLDAVYSTLLKRWKSHALVSETDFLAGVATAMSVISGDVTKNQVWQPAHVWVYMVMGSRSIVAQQFEQQGEESMAKYAEQRQATETLQRIHAQAMQNFIVSTRTTLKSEFDHGPARSRLQEYELRDQLQGIYEHANDLLDKLDMWPPDEMED